MKLLAAIALPCQTTKSTGILENKIHRPPVIVGKVAFGSSRPLGPAYGDFTGVLPDLPSD